MSCFPDDAVEKHPELVRSAIDTAVSVLWSFTGRQFGLCEVEYMPSVSLCRPCRPTLFEGEWYNVDVSSGCQAVYLPGPVFEILEAVNSNGDILKTAPAPWGMQVFGAPVMVRYVKGLPLPPGASAMAGRLASEVFMSCTGDRRCKLPRNTSQVSRSGVSVTMTPAENGKTGLEDVDMWVAALNPSRLATQSEVIL